MTDAPSTGDVYWCENFPGLQGNPAKSRYAIVISPKDLLPDPLDGQGKYLVVPSSASARPSPRNIPLPNRTTNPSTTSGLPCTCHAVCEEYRMVGVEVLTRRVGDLRTALVARLQEVVSEIIEERRNR